MGFERITGMHTSPPLDEPPRVVVRRPPDDRDAARGFVVRQMSELLGVPAGEIGIVVGFELFPDAQRSLGPVRKIAPVLGSSLMCVQFDMHAALPQRSGPVSYPYAPLAHKSNGEPPRSDPLRSWRGQFPENDASLPAI